MRKPFVPAAENNKHAILKVITPWLTAARELIEVGAGSGQHAVHFAAALPHLRWQASELPQLLDGVTAWTSEAALPNLPSPCVLDVTAGAWPAGCWDALYTANTLHYMAWTAVAALMTQAARRLPVAAPLLIYGPFNRDGRHTSPGNARLDAWLRSQNPEYALRDRAAVIALAAHAGFVLCQDHGMPANNHLLAFRRAALDTRGAGPSERGMRGTAP